MKKSIKIFSAFSMLVLLALAGCKKDEYSLGSINAPTGLTVNTTIAGAGTATPTGDGTGNISVSFSSSPALSYILDYGDGETVKFNAGTGGSATHKYNNPGTTVYTITIKAVGTGGAYTTMSVQANVLVLFEIPADIRTFMTDNASKVWVSDRAVQDHFGVGPATSFFPEYYGAPPNTREACAYDDEVTFTKTPAGQITMSVNNMGQSMSIAAATAYYGVSGPDGCYAIPTTSQQLVFMNATSASTPAVSTRIQFRVPGKGNIIFGTGGNTYEILSVSATNMFIRNIGIDGNAWYQKLKKKP